MTSSLYKGREAPLDPLPVDYTPTCNEVASRALIVWEDKVLLVWHGGNHSQGWYTPGGRIKPGEPMQEALAREIEEETGLEVEIGDMVAFFDTFTPREISHKFEFLFLARPKIAPGWVIKDCMDADPDGAVDKMRWFTEAELAKEQRVFPRFVRNFTSLLAPRPRAYYGAKYEENARPDTPLIRLRISTRSVVVHDDRVLMLTSARRGFYCAPGGGVELGEDPLAAADRELQEETGLTGLSNSVIAVDEFFSPTHGNHGINLYIRCTLVANPAPAANWQDHDGGELTQPCFLSRDELQALPRAYPSYMAELAWPNPTQQPVIPAKAGTHVEAGTGG